MKVIKEMKILKTCNIKRLKKAKINTIGHLLEYSPEKLQELKNFGRKSADEVFSTLKNKFGIILNS